MSHDPRVDPILAGIAHDGRLFGNDALRFLRTLEHSDRVSGFNLDWELGTAPYPTPPPQEAMDAFTEAFSSVLAPAGLQLTSCSDQWSLERNFSAALTRGAVSELFGMGLYHGTSSSEWSVKLDPALGSAEGARDRLVVGHSLQPKYPWENTTAAVADRFAAMRQHKVQTTAVFVIFVRVCTMPRSPRVALTCLGIDRPATAPLLLERVAGRSISASSVMATRRRSGTAHSPRRFPPSLRPS